MVYPAAAATGGGGLQAGAPFGQHGRAKGMKMRLRFVVALVAIACAASAAGNSLDSGYFYQLNNAQGGGDPPTSIEFQ